MLNKYGVTYAQQSINIQCKTRQTLLERYNYGSIGANPTFRKKQRETMLLKYGVEQPMHNRIMFNKQQKSKYTRKEYKWQSGEKSILQGYEPIVLKELEDEGYTFTAVITDSNIIPTIPYYFEETWHIYIYIYYPDFYIPSENRIIEVKSKYTLEADWDKNQAKFKATTDAGFNFSLEVR